MAYVIAEPCIGTKDTACVDVCPCDCIHPTKDEREFAASPQLYINPDDWVDCSRASRLARSRRSIQSSISQKNGNNSH